MAAVVEERSGEHLHVQLQQAALRTFKQQQQQQQQQLGSASCSKPRNSVRGNQPVNSTAAEQKAPGGKLKAPMSKVPGPEHTPRTGKRGKGQHAAPCAAEGKRVRKK